MAILDEEQLEWNDECFSELLGEDNFSPTIATSKIIQRIREDPDYIILLLKYAKARINLPFSSPSLIVISKIIQMKPDYFVQNYEDFKPLFISLIDSVKGIPELNQQRLVGNIINCSVKALSYFFQDENERNITIEFFERLFNSCQENLDTNPICLFMMPSIEHFRNFKREKISLVLYNIIIRYYPQKNDFELLVDALRYFCRISSIKFDFDSDYDQIFDAINELAERSIDFEPNQFDKFWSAIHEINISRSGPFFQLAIQFLEETQYDDTKMILFNFIEEHAALILPDQVQFLINIFFDSVLNQQNINLSDYSFLEAISVVDHSIFSIVYDTIIEIINQGFPNSEYIFINTILTMLDKYKLEIAPVLQDIMSKCNDFLMDSLQNENFDITHNILTLFMNIVRVFPDDENARKIPYLLIELFEVDLDLELVKTLLYTIACSIPSIDKQPIFDQLLQIFLENYKSITPKTASFFFYALYSYLPDGRLFPENKYESIRELITFYLDFFETEKTGRFTLSIFLFKMYLQDQGSYLELMPKIIENLCIAYLTDIDGEIIYTCSETLRTYIECFGKDAFPLLNGDEYYTNLLETLMDDNQNSNNFSYLSILSQIAIYDRDNFTKRAEYSRYLILSFYRKESRNMEIVVNCLSELLYRLPNTPLINNVLNRVTNEIPNAINKIDIEQLSYLIKLISSLMQPVSIEFRKDFPEDDYQNIVNQAIQTLEATVSDLISYSTENDNYFRLFFDSIAQIIKSLCPYNSEIIHIFFNMLFAYFDIENEEFDATDKIKEMSEFLNIAYEMVENNILQNEEALMISQILERLLYDKAYIDLFSDLYIILSRIILIDAEYVMPFMKILNEHWTSLDNEYLLSILSTLFLMIFVMVPDNFSSEDVFRMTEEITDRFQPLRENCNYYIKSSIDFLSNYPDVPINIKEKFLHNYITYLSYQGYCYHIFSVKEEVHERLLEVVKILISEIPNCEEIIESCFPESPRALQGTLEMLEIPLQQEQD